MHTDSLQVQLLPSQTQLSVPYRHSNGVLLAQRPPLVGRVAGQTPQAQLVPTTTSLHEQVTLP
jgi:hypothetical protein